MKLTARLLLPVCLGMILCLHGGQLAAQDNPRTRVQTSSERGRVANEPGRVAEPGSLRERVQNNARNITEQRRNDILRRSPMRDGREPDYDPGRPDWRGDRDRPRDWGYNYHSRYRSYPYRSYGYNTIYIIDNNAYSDATSSASYEVEPRKKDQWIPGHYELVPVEDVIDDEFVDVYYPAVYRMDEEGKLQLLEEERTVRQPKVRIIMTRIWVEGHYGPAPDEDRPPGDPDVPRDSPEARIQVD